MALGLSPDVESVVADVADRKLESGGATNSLAIEAAEIHRKASPPDAGAERI